MGKFCDRRCIFITVGTEYSDRPGRVRDLLVKQQEQWLDCLRRVAESAMKVGDFKADADPAQFAFDFYSMILGFHFYHKLLRDTNTEKRQQRALADLLNKYISPTS